MNVLVLWALATRLSLLSAATDCQPKATYKNMLFSESQPLLTVSGYQLHDCLQMCCNTTGCSGVTFRGFLTSPVAACTLLECEDCGVRDGTDSSGLLSVFFHPSLKRRDQPLLSHLSTPPDDLPTPTTSVPLLSTRPTNGTLGIGGFLSTCSPFSIVGILCLLLLLCGLVNFALVASAIARRRRRRRKGTEEGGRSTVPSTSRPSSAYTTHLRAYDNLHLDVDSHPPHLSSSAQPSPPNISAPYRNISTIS